MEMYRNKMQKSRRLKLDEEGKFPNLKQAFSNP
jgi:hypothetical protein